MGKLICDSTTSSPVIPWKDPTTTVAAPASIDTIPAVDLSDEILTIDTTTTTTWDDVSGLEDQQKRHLQRLHAKGVLWKHPGNKIQIQNQERDDNDDDSAPAAVVFRLSHGGDVEADGNCLFTASQKAMGLTEITAKDLRRRTVRRFLEDLGSESNIDAAIKHMYSPDLRSGWGIHVVQELKLLAKKSDRQSLDLAIEELVNLGMQRELAAESIYKERCIAVDDGQSWAKYMSISGSPDDEYNIITLQFTEEGLLTVDENREGHAAAFGDDIAIECLATEFKREIYVRSIVVKLNTKMSGVSLAVAPRSEPDETSSTSTMTTEQKTQQHRQQEQAVVGGVMGSLRVIELQLVAFIMVFSASGLVPLFDLVFPAFTTGYLLILSRLVFPGHGSATTSKEIFQGNRLFRAYVVFGTTIGLFLPLAYVLGGFARGDEHSLQSATPHLFLLSCQILTENVISGLSLFSPPVRALVPMLYTVRRIFVILDWVQDVWVNKSLSPVAEIKDVAWFWFARVLAVANLVYFSINLFGFLIPRFLPQAFD